MVLIKIIFATLLMLGIISPASAQKGYITDTIYYLVDTANIPKKDHKINVGTEVENRYYNHRIDTIKYFQIICKCLPHNYNPTFTKYTRSISTPINKKEVRKIKFLSQDELIKLVIKGYKHDFNTKHIVIIVELIAHKYYKQTVFLTEFSDPVE